MQSMRDFIYLQSLFVGGVVVPGVVVIAVASFRYTVVRESSTGNWQHLLAGLDDRARFFQIFVISVFTVCRMYMIIIFGMISTLIRWYSTVGCISISLFFTLLSLLIFLCIGCFSLFYTGAAQFSISL
jgi:hypothetical protein